MNTQLVKYLVVSILLLQMSCFTALLSSAQTPRTTHHPFDDDAMIEIATETYLSPQISAIWRFNESDISPDQDIEWGLIPNNRMRYAIQRRPGPPSIRLLVNAGLVTEENQAHEGICDLLVKYFTFSNQDRPFFASAYTDFNGNIYSIDLPVEDEHLLDQALETLAAHFKGLILEENDLYSLKETLLSTYPIPELSIDDQRKMFIFSGSQLAQKNTIKDLNPNRGALEDFLQHWYSPDRAILFISDNVPINDTHLKIENQFSSIKAPPITYSTPSIIAPEHSDVDAHVVLDPDADFARILFETIIHKKDTRDSKKTRRQALLNEIEETLMQKRFLEISNQTDEIEDFCIRFYDHLNTLDIRKIRITTSPQDWERAVEIAVDQLVRIVYKGGFTHEEFEYARKQVEEAHKICTEDLPNISNKSIADTFIEKVKKGNIPSNPKDDYHFVKETLAELSVEECNEELFNIWQTQQCYLIAEGNIGINNPSDALDALTQAYLESAFRSVREHKGALDIPDYFTLNKPQGFYPILKTSTYEHLGLAQIRYENNFFLNIASNHSDTECVHMAVRFGMGQLNEDLKKPGLGYLAEHIFLESGLAGFDAETLKALEQALGIELTFEMKEDAFILRGKCPPQNTLTLIKLLFAYVTEPKLSPKAFELAKEKYTENYTKNLESPEGFMKLNGDYYLFTPENPFKAPRPETVARRTLQELKEWIAPVIKEAVFELSIVGAFEANDINSITGTLEQTFATLSPRKLEIDTLPNFHTQEANLGNKNQTYSRKGKEDIWGARIAWPTCDGWSKLETRRLRIVTEILKKRLHKALMLTFGNEYSNKTESLNSLTYNNLGCIQSTVLNTSEHAEKTKKIILDEAQKLAEASSITFDEFEEAIKPLLDEFKAFGLEATALGEQEAFEKQLAEKMQTIANKAMSIVNSDRISYETFKKIMTSQEGHMRKVAYYKASLPEKKDALESDFHALKTRLIDIIKQLNPNDLTLQEIENITLPAIESLIRAKTQIEKIEGFQAQANIKKWFEEKTNSALQQLTTITESNATGTRTRPLNFYSTLEAFRRAPSELQEDSVLNFHALFEAASMKQAERLRTLIDLADTDDIHIHADALKLLDTYRSDFIQIADNLSFQKNTVIKLEKSIQRKTKVLIDNAWELNPPLPNWEAVEAAIKPTVDALLLASFKIQEHLDLEDLLNQSIESTLQDAWNALNPHHITPRELQDAKNALERLLRTKANTPKYWMDNVLIGSQFYPQKLDWAPHLISDYIEADIEEISHTASKYLQRDHAYIIEVLPEK